MIKRFGTGKPRAAIRSSSPAMRQLIEMIDDLGPLKSTSYALGLGVNTIWSWRSGRRKALLQDFEMAAGKLGYKLVLAPIDAPAKSGLTTDTMDNR